MGHAFGYRPTLLPRQLALTTWSLARLEVWKSDVHSIFYRHYNAQRWEKNTMAFEPTLGFLRSVDR